MNYKAAISIILATLIIMSLFTACSPNSGVIQDTESNTIEITESENLTNDEIETKNESETPTAIDTETEINTDTKTETVTKNEIPHETETPIETETVTETVTEPPATVEASERYLIFRIWNFTDLRTLEEFQKIVDRAYLDGFNAIKVHIPWYRVESVSGVYDYSAFDPMIDYVINQKGMKVAMCIDCTRIDGDKVLSSDDIMRFQNGDLVMGGTGNGDRMQISFNSHSAVQKLNAFYADAIAHFDKLYGNDILFYLPTFSMTAESEYWGAVGFNSETNYADYSDNAIVAFRAFLAENYDSIESLNAVLGTNYASFEDVTPPLTVTNDAFGQLWYIFRHQSLKNVIDMLATTQKKIAPKSKFALQFGSVVDLTFERGTLGFADLCENADVVYIDDAPSVNHRFSLDWISSSLPDNLELAMEIDGPSSKGASPEAHLAQATQSFERGVTYINVANFYINDDYENYCHVFKEIADTWLGESTPEILKPDETSPTIKISLLELFRNRDISVLETMYKALAPNGEAVRIVIIDDLTNAIPKSNDEFGAFPIEFSSEQGKDGWYYKSYLNGTYTDMVFDEASGYWQGDSKYTMITPTYLHPHNHDAALVYKAEKTGRVKITVHCAVSSENSDGISFRILNGKDEIDLAKGEGSLIISYDQPFYKVLEFDVEAGDEIAFIVGKNQTVSNDSTRLAVYVQYE